MPRSTRSSTPKRKNQGALKRLKPRLVLTGERRNQRFLVLICGKEVWLTCVLFNALCQLVSARADGKHEFLKLDAMVISRLRRAIREATNGRLASTMITTGDGREYRLNLEVSQIAVHPSFNHLPAAFVNRARTASLWTASTKQTHKRAPLC